MELIDAQAVRRAVCNVDIPEGVTEGQFAAVLGNVCEALQMLPIIDAVPLDKLCEWLSNHAGRPIDCQDHLCGKCEFDDVGVGQEMCWKALITKWMEEEEHNGTDDP